MMDTIRDDKFFEKPWFLEWLKLARRDYHGKMDGLSAPYVYNDIYVAEIQRVENQTTIY